MKLTKFSQFITENSAANMKRLQQLGIAPLPAQEVYDILTDEVDGYFELEENTIKFITDWALPPESFDLQKYTIRDFGGELEVILDFDKMEMTVWISIQHDQLDIDEEYQHTGPMSDYLKVLPTYYGKGQIEPKNTKELAKQLVQMFRVWDWGEDPFQIWENVKHILNTNIKR